MNLKARLQEHSQTKKVKWEVIEQDYVLSWVLEAFSSLPELKDNIVFKGGTALKKMYFGEYRFSQDLDFSVREDVKDWKNLEQFIQEACSIATQTVQSSGENVEFKSAIYTEKKPHPEGQQAFVVQARLPWHRDFHTKVYAEFSFQELIVMEPETRKIIHSYGDALVGHMSVYPLEEIVAEKIRALLQFAKKLHERGWGRSRVRDYYDLWRILSSYSDNLNLCILPTLVQKKCSHKNIAFGSINDIFQEKLMMNMEKEWESWLLDIVPDLPKKELVLKNLREKLGPIFRDNLG